MSNELDKTIGTKEKPRLTAGSVIVDHVEIRERPKKGGGGMFKIVEFYCLHPDQDSPIMISNCKVKTVQGNNETLKIDGIWYKEDDDSNIDKNCNTARVMNFYSKTTLKAFEKQSVQTELTPSGYLAIKCY